MQNTAAYAMTVVTFLLRNTVTAYMLAWVRPFGLSPLTTLASDALKQSTLPEGSLLRNALTDVVAFTRSERFKGIRSTVRSRGCKTTHALAVCCTPLYDRACIDVPWCGPAAALPALLSERRRRRLLASSCRHHAQRSSKRMSRKSS